MTLGSYLYYSFYQNSSNIADNTLISDFLKTHIEKSNFLASISYAPTLESIFDIISAFNIIFIDVLFFFNFCCL